jgi:exopolysaccharide biosynthesis protein
MAQEINYKARRTILAYTETIIYVIAIESPGMNFYEVQNMLMEMDLDYAINLDGGGSTKILENGKSITSTLYNRAVDNVIAFYLKPKVIYRV